MESHPQIFCLWLCCLQISWLMMSKIAFVVFPYHCDSRRSVGDVSFEAECRNNTKKRKVQPGTYRGANIPRNRERAKRHSESVMDYVMYLVAL